MTSRLDPCLTKLKASLVEVQAQTSAETISRIEDEGAATRDMLREQSNAAQKTGHAVLQGLERALDRQIPKGELWQRLNDLQGDIREVKATVKQGSTHAESQECSLAEVNTQLVSLSLGMGEASAHSLQEQQRTHTRLEEMNFLLGTMAATFNNGMERTSGRSPDGPADGALGRAAQELARCIWLVFHALSMLVREFM